MITLGIDLGTSAVRAALYRNASAELTRFPDGGTILPAAVTWNQGIFHLGHAALTRAARMPHLTVRAVKRILGRAGDDPLVDLIRPRTPFPVVADDRDGLALVLGEDRVAPQTIAAFLLSHVADVVELACEERPEAAVLCAPQWFTCRQRTALQEAAGLAGLETLRIIDDTTATALSLPVTPGTTRLVAIVDIGAGGCTASIVELQAGCVRVLASAGDPHSGGDDVDWSLVAAILHEAESRAGAIPQEAQLTELLRSRCELAKRCLEHQPGEPATLLALRTEGGRADDRIVVDRRLADEVLKQPALRIRRLCTGVLRSAALAPERVSAVVVTGGMARLASIRKAVLAAFGAAHPGQPAADGSVALGAARLAANLTGLADYVAVHDKLNEQDGSAPPSQVVHGSHPLSVRTVRIPVAQRGAWPPNGLLSSAGDAPGEGECPVPLDGYPELDTMSTRGVRGMSPSGPISQGDSAQPLLHALVFWAREQAQARHASAALDMLAAAEHAYSARHAPEAARAFRRRVGRALFTREWLDAALAGLAPESDPEPRAVEALRACFHAQPDDDLFDAALSWFGDVRSPSVRAVLLHYLERFVETHAPEVSNLLRDAPPDQALNLLATLRDTGTVQAKDAAAAALSSAHAIVRLQALSFLGEDCPGLPRELLAQLIADPEPEVRRAALALIRAQRIVSAGPTLARRIRSAAYDALPEWEREELLHTAGMLSRRRTDELAILLLEQTAVFTSQALEATRAIAAAFLAESDSMEAQHALERAAARKWANSAVVRDLAARGAESVQRRRSRRPQPQHP